MEEPTEQELKIATKKLADKSGIKETDVQINEVLSSSKQPVRRLGQGIHNEQFYYGTAFNWKGRPISSIITSKRKIFLGLNYINWKCKSCNYVTQTIETNLRNAKPPKNCNCLKSNDRDFIIENVFNPIKNDFGLNYRTEFNEDSIDYAWQTEDIKKYLDGDYKKETLQDIFNKIIEINKKYIEHLNPITHNLIACSIIGTYCFTIFEQFGRLYFRAERGSGKTKQCRIIKFLAFNPMWITKGTESSIFRDAEGTSGTFIVDNMDKLSEDLLRAMEHHIETGWMYDATYRLTDKESGRTQKFLSYSPMIVNNIFGLDDNTIDKTFEIPMLKSVNNEIKKNKPTYNSENWREISNSIRCWMLDNWQIVQKNYQELSSTFSGREFDVVEGILTIAKTIGEETYKEIETYIQEEIAKQVQNLEDNPHCIIFSKIWKSFLDHPNEQEFNVFVGQLAKELFLSLNPDLIEGTKEYSNKKKGCSKYVASIIKSVPMFRKGGHSNGVTYLIVQRKDLERYMKLQKFVDEQGHLLITTTNTTSTKSLTYTPKEQNEPFKVDDRDVIDEVDEKSAKGNKNQLLYEVEKIR